MADTGDKVRTFISFWVAWVGAYGVLDYSRVSAGWGYLSILTGITLGVIVLVAQFGYLENRPEWKEKRKRFYEDPALIKEQRRCRIFNVLSLFMLGGYTMVVWIHKFLRSGSTGEGGMYKENVAEPFPGFFFYTMIGILLLGAFFYGSTLYTIYHKKVRCLPV